MKSTILKKHGYEADFKKLEYSINKGLWGHVDRRKGDSPFRTDAPR